jgi:Phage replication protein CRI/Phage X family
MTKVVNIKDFACERSTSWNITSSDLYQEIGFCDWVSIYQQHPQGGLPKYSDGAIVTIDRYGETRNVLLKRERIEGSYESSIMVKCDGHTVEFSGNVSKFNRQDNVFGFSFEDCLNRINAIITNLGLPAFTAGERMVINQKGNPVSIWTGAKLTRLDVTQNFACGSKQDASHFMRFMQMQQADRIKTGTYGDGETVDFGRHSRRLYFKIYVKGPELRKHGSGEYIEKLADWADEIGLVRAELTLKPLKLKDLGCSYLGGLNMRVITNEFKAKCEVFTRATADVSDIPALPSAVLGTLRMWENGDDIPSKLSRSTFFRHRAILLPFGIDISVRSSVIKFPVRTRVISLVDAEPPSFYQHEG